MRQIADYGSSSANTLGRLEVPSFQDNKTHSQSRVVGIIGFYAGNQDGRSLFEYTERKLGMEFLKVGIADGGIRIRSSLPAIQTHKSQVE